MNDDVERVTDDAGGTTPAMVKLARKVDDESASDVIGYDLTLMVWPFMPFLACLVCEAYHPSCDIDNLTGLVIIKNLEHSARTRSSSVWKIMVDCLLCSEHFPAHVFSSNPDQKSAANKRNVDVDCNGSKCSTTTQRSNRNDVVDSCRS